MGSTQSTWGVTPRNSFSRETRTQDKADGQLQKRIFVNSLCAHSEGTYITSLKSCPKCEPSLSLHLLQALQPSSNLVQTLLRPQRKINLRIKSLWISFKSLLCCSSILSTSINL